MAVRTEAQTDTVLTAQTRRGSRTRSALAAATIVLAWLGVFATAVVALSAAGTPTTQIVHYLPAWVIGCTFPGLMVWRALARHSTIVRELGFGSVLGIVLQLIAWAAATSIGHPRAEQ